MDRAARTPPSREYPSRDMLAQYFDWRDKDRLLFEQAMWAIENNAIPSGLKPRNGGRVYWIKTNQ
jgi:hypothetical protein